MIRPGRIARISFVCSIPILVCLSYFGGRALRLSTFTPNLHRTSASNLTSASLAGAGDLTRELAPEDASPAETFQEVYQYVKSDYVDRVDDERKLGYSAVRSMLLALDDPTTRFLDPAEKQRLLHEQNGVFQGIGATFAIVKQRKNGIESRRLSVLAPVPGGPADRAGIRAGDVITHVDGKWVIAYSPRQDFDSVSLAATGEDQHKLVVKSGRPVDGIPGSVARHIMSDTTETTVALTVERSGEPAPIKLSIQTVDTATEPTAYESLGSDALYLRVTIFNSGATGRIQEALRTSPRTVILDLRGNGGGPVPVGRLLPESAETLLSLLTKGGVVGNVIRRTNRAEPIIVNGAENPAPRIVVLINGGTANVAELVALALKERTGATLIGSPTFGNAVYQKLVNLRDGSAMLVAAGRLQSSKGVEFGGGVQPDVLLKTGGPHGAGDQATQRAMSMIGG